MAFIEKFLGKRVEIREDLRYSSKQGLWARNEGQAILFGMSEPALVLAGGINALEWLAPQEQEVQKSDALVFAITGKILYIEAPIDGRVYFNPEVKEDPSIILQDPYGRGWLFKIKSDEDLKQVFEGLDTALVYAESLRSTEGFKNPEGLKGGVSGICKAVYTGIREQKI